MLQQQICLEPTKNYIAQCKSKDNSNNYTRNSKQHLEQHVDKDRQCNKQTQHIAATYSLTFNKEKEIDEKNEKKIIFTLPLSNAINEQACKQNQRQGEERLKQVHQQQLQQNVVVEEYVTISSEEKIICCGANNEEDNNKKNNNNNNNNNKNNKQKVHNTTAQILKNNNAFVKKSLKAQNNLNNMLSVQQQQQKQLQVQNENENENENVKDKLIAVDEENVRKFYTLQQMKSYDNSIKEISNFSLTAQTATRNTYTINKAVAEMSANSAATLILTTNQIETLNAIPTTTTTTANFLSNNIKQIKAATEFNIDAIVAVDNNVISHSSVEQQPIESGIITAEAALTAAETVTAPLTVPLQQHEEEQTHYYNSKKTIDFNSRRRRGRLRLGVNNLLLPMPTVNKQQQQKQQQQQIVAAIMTAISMPTCLLLASCAFAWKIALRTKLLVLLLLSLIVESVYKTKLLVLSATCRLSDNIRATKIVVDIDSNKNINSNSKSVTTASALVKNLATINMNSAYATNKNVMKIANNATIEKQQQQQQQQQQQIIIEKSKKMHNKKRLNKNSLSYVAGTIKAVISYFSANNMQFVVFAFVLCTSILLPCSSNVVSAAKPKSATQLQQKQHQHHQSQQGIGMSYDHGHGFGDIGDALTPPSYKVIPSDTELVYPISQFDDAIFEGGESEEDEELSELNENASYETHNNNETHYGNKTIDIKTPLFPKDLFTKEQLERGAVICHIIGVIYMFVALAIVCDEFFVPSLDVIIEKLDITDDVAGATFMAAGGSAPELFTSVIGVFVSFDDVGIGTIVGSAVFNILFVIGMCALFSKTVLTLTWWPLFRDCTFYSISLLVLIYFFRDSRIYWWEALILFFIYIAYVTFMKWNVQVEQCVKRLITKNKPGGSVTSRAASETRSGPPGSSSGAGTTGNSSGGTAGSTQTGAKFRHGLLQLMIHTIDPLHDGKVDEKATQLHAIASLKVLLDATKPQRGGATTSAANHVKINLKETTLADRPNGNIDTTLDSANEIEDEPEPLSMAWPDTARKRLTYILVAPLLIPMWLTLPDTRTPRGKKYFPITFIGSILWIAAFSYLMVWWANVAGDTARIPPEVMGLTFLAAGTSIPDLITSVIVARKGFGDMAVSSSVGSNIFDVTVGLPIPWLLFGIFYSAPVEVNSVGMVCSITILFMMLVFVVMSIACFRWRMNKGLGFTMFLLYFVFVAVSLMFEYDKISCPV